jgi:hypothetical protein
MTLPRRSGASLNAAPGDENNALLPIKELLFLKIFLNISYRNNNKNIVSSGHWQLAITELCHSPVLAVHT